MNKFNLFLIIEKPISNNLMSGLVEVKTLRLKGGVYLKIGIKYDIYRGLTNNELSV